MNYKKFCIIYFTISAIIIIMIVISMGIYFNRLSEAIIASIVTSPVMYILFKHKYDEVLKKEGRKDGN